MDTPKSKTRISLKTIFNDLFPNFEDETFNVQLFVSVILGLLLAIYVFFKFYKTTSKKNAVAILGPCGSGKTQLFCRLCHGVDVLSVTSVKESSGYYSLDDKKKLLMFDIPGHDRIRYSLFDKVKSQIKDILFVLDASTIQEDIKDVAEFLYTVFCDGVVQACKPHVFIVCNKQDLPSAKGSALIKSSLEKEMNLLRVTKSNQLSSVGGGSENNNSFLGYPDQDFEFSHLRSIKVSFGESVAKNGSLQDITKFLDSVI